MKRVLITGGRAPVALDLARAFAAAGSTVFVADSARCFLAQASRAVTRSFRVPPPRQLPREFAESVRQIVLRERIDLVVPTCEEVFYLSRYAALLRDCTELFCPAFDLISELHDKWRFSQLAPNPVVAVPPTFLLRSRADLELLQVPASELVFKPVFSRFAVHTLVCPSPAEVAALRPSAERTWVAQRYIEGRERCSYSVARQGHLAAHAVYEPSWRAGRGSGYFFQPIANAAIEEFVRGFVTKIRYTGQIAFDFIEDANGKVHVLECNPRATSGVHLFDPASGLAGAFDGSTRELVRPHGARAGMLAPAMLLLGLGHAIRHGRKRAFLDDWGSARDALWSRRDPLPSLYLYPGLAFTLLTALRRGVSPQAASTRDIEWDGETLP